MRQYLKSRAEQPANVKSSLENSPSPYSITFYY
jgi:hypothetical protein